MFFENVTPAQLFAIVIVCGAFGAVLFALIGKD